MTTEVTVSREANLPARFTAVQVKAQVQVIQEIMRDIMIKDTHYGEIPGCGKKPALLKAGAEVLAMTFRLAPSYKIERLDLPGGHREYIITCELRHIETGTLFGAGVGSCSTMESKYRWRVSDDFEVTDMPIPKDSKERKSEYRKQGFAMKKIDNEWKWVRFIGDGSRVENPDIADQYNTVLKMGKKRAQVDATLTALAASDIFTQDIEERLEDAQHVTATVVESQPLQPAKQAAQAQAPSPNGPVPDDTIAKATKYSEECETIAELSALRKEMQDRGWPTWSKETIAIILARHAVLVKLGEQEAELNGNGAMERDRA